MKAAIVRNKSMALLGGLFVLAVVSYSTPARAVQFSFDALCITNNNPDNCATGAQYKVDVTDPVGDNNVLFTFTNSGPVASSITDIYFDDGTLLALSTVTSGPGTSFGTPATPGDLPGGNNATPPFVTTATFSADSNPPVTDNGINPGGGEFVSILFTLQSGQEFQTVLDDLADGDLRIGIHVQAIGATGGSESFVCCGGGSPGGSPGQVPEPSTLVLLGSGLLALGGIGRTFRQKK